MLAGSTQPGLVAAASRKTPYVQPRMAARMRSSFAGGVCLGCLRADENSPLVEDLATGNAPPHGRHRPHRADRPYTFVVLALLLLIIGPLAALRTPTDIFPDIRIPVIGVVWQYTGLPPDQMAGRVATPFQRALTTTVNDIEHIEANSYIGVGIIKIFFQPASTFAPPTRR